MCAVIGTQMTRIERIGADFSDLEGLERGFYGLERIFVFWCSAKKLEFPEVMYKIRFAKQTEIRVQSVVSAFQPPLNRKKSVQIRSIRGIRVPTHSNTAKSPSPKKSPPRKRRQ
jgi:hypothetical protein